MGTIVHLPGTPLGPQAVLGSMLERTDLEAVIVLGLDADKAAVFACSSLDLAAMPFLLKSLELEVIAAMRDERSVPARPPARQEPPPEGAAP